MREIFFIEQLHATDLVMYQYGTEHCIPGHSYGPAVRDYHLIHFIHDGRGIFHTNGQTYHLQKGQGFLIAPNIITYYQADQEEPWHYSWVGFQGLKAETYLQHAGLRTESPIFHYDRDDFVQDCFKQMLETKIYVKSRDVRLLGFLHLLLSQLIDSANIAASPTDNRETYVQRAVETIAKNYGSRLLIGDLANEIGLDRSYLSTLFKEKLGMSPQVFLIRFRMDKACELMKIPELTIGDIARSVGYEDPLLFSKVFRKVKGVSPREFRRDCSSK